MKNFLIIISVICILLNNLFCDKNKSNPVYSTSDEIVWIRSGLDNYKISAILALPGNYLLAGTNNGLFKSTNNGLNWDYVKQEISNGLVTCFSVLTDSNILAGTAGKGLYLSSDRGNNWSNIGLEGIYITAIAVNNYSNLYICTRGSGIIYSDSLTGGFTQINKDFRNQTFLSLLITLQNIIFAGGTGVYYSADNGKTWELKNAGLGNWSVYSLIRLENGFIDAGTDMGGFFQSKDNGNTWVKLNKGLTNTEILSLAIGRNGLTFVGTWRGGVFMSSNNGADWAAVDSGLVNKEVSIILVSPDNYLFSGTSKGVFRSETTLK